MTTFQNCLDFALCGCVHEFNIASRETHRSTIVRCVRCGCEATHGEVAWMLAGGHLVREAVAQDARTQRSLHELANMPTQGGVQ